MRARRKAALVKVEDPATARRLGVAVGDFVWPEPHDPSDATYTTSACAHCRPEHTYLERVRKVANTDTDVLPIGSLHPADLVALAAHHLEARTRAATIPPPPALLPARRQARHRRTG